jgi:hypothetical protein
MTSHWTMSVDYGVEEGEQERVCVPSQQIDEGDQKMKESVEETHEKEGLVAAE